MQLISKYNKGIQSFCYKSAWVVLLKDKKNTIITNAIKNFLDESEGRKPNKKLEDKRKEFYNRFMKSWLQDKSEENP